MTPTVSRPNPFGSALSTVAPWLAPMLPLVIGLWRASSISQWRDDRALLRAVGLAPPALQESFSALAASALLDLPLGGKWLRVTLLSVLALGFSAFLIFSIAERLASRLGAPQVLAQGSALAAAWLVTLSPLWQSEGTVAGGGTFSASLALLAMWLCLNLKKPKALPWLGAVFGMLLAEDWGTASLTALAVAACLALRRQPLTSLPEGRRSIVLSTVLLGWVSVGLSLGQWARSSNGAFDLSTLGDVGFRVGLGGEPIAPLVLIEQNFTLLSLVPALAGAAFVVVRAEARAQGAMLWAVTAMALWLCRAPSETEGAERGVVFSLLALGGLGVLAGVGAASLARLGSLGIPLTRVGARLLVALVFLLTLLGFERSSEVADRRDHVGSEAWTDDALTDLPPGSILLLKRRELALHLLAARSVGGQRPDLLVIPLSALATQRSTEEWLRLEPALSGVLKDLLLSGRMSEYSLSTLAGARPLFVDFDATWDKRLLEHLLPQGFWVRFSPHALASSDRRGVAQNSLEAMLRVKELSDQPGRRDKGTLNVIWNQMTEHAIMLQSLGEQRAARQFAEKADELALSLPISSKDTRADQIAEKALAAHHPAN